MNAWTSFHETQTRQNYSPPGPHDTDDISRSSGEKSRSANGHGNIANSIVTRTTKGFEPRLTQNLYFIYAGQELIRVQGHLKVKVTQKFSGGIILIGGSPWTSV